MPDFQINGDKLRSFRRARGWTQLELALIAGVSERTVRNAERGQPLRRNFLDYLAQALEVETTELVANPEVLRPALRWNRIVQRLLERMHIVVNEYQPNGLLDLMQPNVAMSHFADNGIPRLPFTGEYARLDGMRRYFDLAMPFTESVRERQVVYEGPRGGGNVVILQFLDSFLLPDDGNRLAIRVLHIYEFERERLHRIDAWNAPCPPGGVNGGVRMR